MAIKPHSHMNVISDQNYDVWARVPLGILQWQLMKYTPMDSLPDPPSLRVFILK